MSKQEDDFYKRLLTTFRLEAEEHLQTIGAGLLELEKAKDPGARRPLIETAFRAAHSLKGAARAVDLGEIESICQSLEDVFVSWKRQEITPSSRVLDSIHRSLDVIAKLLAGREDARLAFPSFRVAPSGIEPPEVERARAKSLSPTATATSVAAYPPGRPGRERDFRKETVRIAVDKLDALVLEAEEMTRAKMIASARVNELRDLARRTGEWRTQWAHVEAGARSLREKAGQAALRNPTWAEGAGLTRLAEFLDWNATYFKALESKIASLTQAAERDSYAIGRLVDSLLEDSKQLLLLPFSTITATFSKLVRDLSRDQGKEIALVIRGEDVEIDKRILEEIKDPLIHVLRNAVDHGIELPPMRARLGKPPGATITLTVSRADGGKVEICVSDDGSGIDAGGLKESAVKEGLLTAQEAAGMGAAAARALAFEPDVSTSPAVTRLSGRGLGLAIVREKAEKLGGEAGVESDPSLGTRVRIVLPSMLSTFRGILVEDAGRLYVLPTAQVERVTRMEAGDVRTVEGRETISMNGRAIALVSLSDTLEMPHQTPSAVPPDLIVMILGTGEQRVAFTIDKVLDELQVLVKPLSKPLSRVRNLAGATVLVSGQLVPVLNVNDLLKSAKRACSSSSLAVVPAKQEESGRKTILVAEDSITSRMLLKTMLEAAGYCVKTAVDGIDALTLLRREHFDLIVSDVEMPRLNGFDLTMTVRSDARLAGLPVVLVTTLEAREDRERGIEVGADAYVVKSSFDQSNLLETVRRLL